MLCPHLKPIILNITESIFEDSELEREMPLLVPWLCFAWFLRWGLHAPLLNGPRWLCLESFCLLSLFCPSVWVSGLCYRAAVDVTLLSLASLPAPPPSAVSIQHKEWEVDDQASVNARRV